MNPTGRLARLLVLAAAAAAILAGASRAAPPSNDRFAAAQELQGESGSVRGTTAEATREVGEPAHGEEGGAGRTVWYRWTAPASVSVLFETCGATSFDTLLAAYVGSHVAALSRVARDDDSCETQSRIAFAAAAGTTYMLAVDGVDRAGTFTLSWRVLRPPPNDDFASAMPLSGASGSAGGETFAAGVEPGEPGARGGATVWYRWTAPFSGGVTFETCRSSFDTVLTAYAGTALASLRPIATSDDACESQSRIRFQIRAGATYVLQLGGSDGETGEIDLSWRAARRAPNDAFARARRLLGANGSVSDSNVGAFGRSGALWYRWRAPRTMPIAFATCSDATFDTVVSVYRGASSRRAVLVDRDDDGCREEARSRAVFLAIAGVDYRIAVAGFRGATGSFRLTWGSPRPFDDPCRVPDVVHEPLARVEPVLRRANCRIGRIAYVTSPIVPAGRVIDQFPKPFTRLPVFARVNLLVSRGA